MSRVSLSAAALVVIGLSTTMATHARVSVRPHQQSSMVHLLAPTLVSGTLLRAGEYTIVHDEDKMARGGPCTTFYCVDTAGRLMDAVSFHCRPVAREPVASTTLSIVIASPEERGGADSPVEKLIEYQFAGEREGHGVPEDRSVHAPHFSMPDPGVADVRW